jgi:hypothetical protein
LRIRRGRGFFIRDTPEDTWFTRTLHVTDQFLADQETLSGRAVLPLCLKQNKSAVAMVKGFVSGSTVGSRR